MWLIFDRTHDYLGELICQDGALRSVVLSAKGESEIGPAVAVWQTQGLPVKHPVLVRHAHGPDDPAFYVERVQPREPGFCDAFRHWAEEQGVLLVEYPEERLWYWESLLRAPLSPAERFVYALGISKSDGGTLISLKQLFQDAQADPNLKQSARRQRALNQLKVKLARQVTGRLVHSA